MQKGFTIVELLVVIVVIGILASISIISYNGIQKRANDTSVQADLESIAGELEAYRTRESSTNPNHEFPRDSTQLATLEIKAAKKAYDLAIPYNMIYCIATSGSDAYQAYKLTAKSKSGGIYMMTQDGFQSQSLTSADLTANFCTAQGMTLGSNGMSPAGMWQAWVHSS